MGKAHKDRRTNKQSDGLLRKLFSKSREGLGRDSGPLRLAHQFVEPIECLFLVGTEIVLGSVDGDEPAVPGFPEPGFWTTCHER
jgi:hypothetical protein